MIFETPFSLEAEQSVIGAFMHDGLKTDAVITAFESLSADNFYHAAHQEIFNAIGRLVDRKFATDLVTVCSEATAHKEYLVEIFRGSPGAVNTGFYATLVKQKATERRLIDILQMSQNAVADGSIPYNEKIDRVHSLLKDIDSGGSGVQVNKISHYLSEVVDEVNSLHNGDTVAGLPTGFSEIDSNIGGLVDGELITLGARTSVGKSALGMNISENIARSGKNVLYITMEMAGKALTGRVICSQGRVDNAILKTPANVNQAEWSKFSAGVHRTEELSVFIADMPRPSANDIKAVARNFKRKQPLDILVIDHLHLMRHDKKFGEVQGLADTTAELKGLAIELGVPVLLMAQLNRGNAKEDRPPALTDLRGSGAIEQDSDIVMLIHRDDSEGSELKGKALVLIPKNRSGVKDTGIILTNNLHNYRFDTFSNQEARY